MGWIWLDDLMPEHPKILEVGGEAAWLHICAIAYCNRNNTNGTVPAAQVARLADIRKPLHAVDRLVEAGLWHDWPGHYEVHDYADYQLTREQRELRSEAGKEGARRRWQTNGTGHSKRKGPAKA